MQEEFDAIGAPAFDKRGVVSGEYISCFKELWTSNNPSFEGKYVRFTDITFEPKPIQKPHPPIWIGGESPAALRRAAELGDGWFPLGGNPRFPIQTVQQLSDALEKIYRHGENVGRDLTKFDLAYSFPDSFTGTAEQVTEDIRAFKAAGVRHLMVSLGATFSAPVSDTLEHMEYFASEIAPHINS
jgi:alkanesulfonate monooxygenase SsuD/methylene tetrahydromethanopterin reductase-like flavin-dependent oxidoreductase (luciferase family)